MGKFYHLFYLSNLLGVNLQSGALLVRTEEQINEADDQKECYYSADTESTGGDQRTDSDIHTGIPHMPDRTDIR